MTGVKRTGKRVIKRKPGVKSNNYFTTQTQEAIVKYQQTEDSVDKHSIYTQEIHPAFIQLVENLIRVYGFSVTHDSRKDLRDECVQFLYTTLLKFKSEKNSKAFSYFNVVAKNFLTVRSKTNYKNLQRLFSIDQTDSFSQFDIEKIENYRVVPTWEEMKEEEEIRAETHEIIEEIERNATSDNEKEVMKAIKIIFSEVDELDLISKRAVLLYIREITGLNSKQLSIILSGLKKHYNAMKEWRLNKV